MRIELKKRSTGQIEFGIIYGSIALFLLVSARVLPILSITPSCVFKGITGIPCPTCGATRSVVLLSKGYLATAFAMNPLVTLSLIAAVTYFLYSVITLTFNIPQLSFLLTDHEKKAVHTMAVILILVQWAYLISAL